jgi:subtilisin family serine protease
MNCRPLLAAAVLTLIAVGSSTSATAERYLVRRAAPAGLERDVEARFEQALERRGGRVLHQFHELNVVAVEVEPEGARELAALAGIRDVEPDPLRWVSGLREKQLAPSPSNGLYGLVRTRMNETLAAHVAGLGIRIGVADTALDCGHPDLAGALISSFDATGNGGSCIGQRGVDPGEIHATHVAGTALARNNKLGVVGGAPEARLLHARVCSGVPGQCFGSDVMEGVRGLVDRGAQIVNLSLGGANSSSIEQDFFRGIRDEGVLVVAASGNADGAPVSFPAGYEGVMAVGAVDSADVLATFSNIGSALDVVAPGVGVLSSVPRNQGRDPSLLATKNESFAATDFTFGPLTPKAGVRKKLVDCGLGHQGECPTSVKGQIALIQRGELFFSEKVANAMAQGAAGVVIFNNAPGLFAGTLQTALSPSGKKWIPVIAVSDTTGATLEARFLGKLVTLFSVVSDYGTLSGTSMATPHVVAAAALVWAAHPDLDADGVEQRLIDTAEDLGDAGFDVRHGFGRIDAMRAIQE